MKNIKLYGCPLHLGVSNVGIMAGIDVLNNRFDDIAIEKIDELTVAESGNQSLKNLNSVVATCTKIAHVTDAIIKQGDITLFIGGDHASAIGTVAGVAANVDNLGLLWVDSHADINTNKTTITGNIHGMPVSALMGYGDENLVSIMYEGTKIMPQNIVLFGLRDVDPLEFEIIEKLDIKYYTYEDIKKRGLKSCLNEVATYLNGTCKTHLSFDLDSMDPDVIKGVSVPVTGGFNQAEAIDIIYFALKKLDISSIDIVEYNEKNDTDRYTADFVYQLIKKITDFYSKE